MMRRTARIIDNPRVIEVLATSHALQRWWDAPPPPRDGRKLEDAVWRGAMSPVLEEDPPASDSGFFSFTEAPGSPPLEDARTLPAERIIEMKDKIHERKEHLRQVCDPPVDSINRLLPGEGGGAAVPRGASRRAGPSQHFARHHLAPLLWEAFGHLTLCAGNRDTVAVGHLLHCLTIIVLRTVALILY